LPAPPHSGLLLFCHGGEPVLPEHCTYLGGWLARKRITCKESEHIGIVFEQSHLGIGHNWIFTPRAEWGEPQVPVETRLIRRVDARRLARVLGVITKRMRDPILPILVLPIPILPILLTLTLDRL